MTRLIIAALLALTTACVTTQKASEEWKTKNTDDMTDCFMRSAIELDDGVSGAYTIGRSIASRCDFEVKRVINVYSRGYNRRVQEMVRSQMKESVIDNAAETVLEFRRQKRLGKELNKPPKTKPDLAL